MIVRGSRPREGPNPLTIKESAQLVARKRPSTRVPNCSESTGTRSSTPWNIAVKCIGVYGVLARRNAILVLMSVELMLNAVNINLVAFDVWLRDELLAGQVFTLFVITIAAAEVGLGLAIVLLVFRQRATASLDQLTELHEPVPAGEGEGAR